jgi:hypothetical protein
MRFVQYVVFTIVHCAVSLKEVCMEENHRQDNHEQAVENVVSVDAPIWVKPGFEIIGVSLECTAYAGCLEE